jgi:hypothetical protein
MPVKTLYIDVETTPNTLSGWGLREQNFGINQVLEPSRLLCFAAKWAHKDTLMFSAEWQKAGRQAMLDKAHRLLDEADEVVAHNAPFDVKQLNTGFWLAGMAPPAPYKVVDTLRPIRRQFFLTSNRLDFIARVLNLEGKVSHEGHGLWLAVMEGNRNARALMTEYNKQDVVLLEQVHRALAANGWLPNGAHHGALLDLPDGCPGCGSLNVQRRGYAVSNTGRKQRFQCSDCGTWAQSARMIKGTGTSLRRLVNQ